MTREDWSADDELWRDARPNRNLPDDLYAELLNGSARPDLIDELIAADNELAAIVSAGEASPGSTHLRDRIVAQWPLIRSTTRDTDANQAVRFARWTQWSSLAASLLVASAAGLYLGRSVGEAERPELPEATFWANDIDGLSLEGMIPGHQGDS
jgi:hypothetical protein